MMKNYAPLVMGIIAVVMVVGGTCAAAAEDEVMIMEQPQQVLWAYDILLRGVSKARGGGVVDDNNNSDVDNKLGCIPVGKPCNIFTSEKNDCCPGSACHMTGTPFYTEGPKCVWCPGEGGACGAADPCCPGLTCDGFFNGHCHK